MHQSANRSELTPLRFLERSAHVFPDAQAVVYDGRTYTYSQLAHEAQQLAKALTAHVEPGERVAFMTPNVPEFLVAHFAVPLTGAVLVPINTRLSAHEVKYILQHSEAKVLFIDTELAHNLGNFHPLPDSVQLVIEVPDHTTEIDPAVRESLAFDLTYEAFLKSGEGKPDLPWAVDDEERTISINYTSGTTGSPKGVMYTHRGAYLGSMGAVTHNQLTGDSRYLWTLPMFHCNGWLAPWAVTSVAATHYCLRAVRGDKMWQLITEHGITHMWGAPTVLMALAESRPEGVFADGLRITTAGAPPSPTIIEQIEQLGATVTHVYGLTEVYGPFTISEPQPSWADLDVSERAKLTARQGVGMVQADTVRVVDLDMQDVTPDGQTFGEIVMRGNIVMKGYFNDEAATEKAFHGGWFHSGDIAVMHPDGYVEIKDRAKDIIISGGENISSVEVEQALIAHPALMECAVIGIPDEKWGERPCAFIVLRAEHHPTDEDLIAHLRERLAGYKVPRIFVRLDELPHTATGKILKYALRDNYEQLLVSSAEFSA